jgi:hypothetical protein
MNRAAAPGATALRRPPAHCLRIRAPVKKPKKKIALPRRQWQINPSTRVKGSAKVYSRAKSKQNLQKPQNEE